MKIFLILLLFIVSLVAKNIQEPISSYIASGGVIDIVRKDTKLYVATKASSVDIFDLNSKKLLQSVKLDKIKDFMGDEIDSKVYSVDVLDDKILILSQGKSGFRRVHIYENGALKLLIPTSKHLYIAEAKFLNKNTIVYALLGNDIVSYDSEKLKENWTTQASQSKFSHFVLSEDKKEVVIADESGDLKIIDTHKGKILKNLSGENLDNVFKVDYKNGIIATAGQDRRVVIYNLKHSRAYYKMANFLVYSVGLSASGNFVGYASDENNNVTVFNTKTKKSLGLFGGNKMTLSAILFLSESEFLVASDDKTINRYKIGR